MALRFWLFLLVVTAVAFDSTASVENREYIESMKCIWVTAKCLSRDSANLDSCSIANQYLGKYILVQIDSVSDNYVIDNYHMPFYRLKKVNPTVFRWRSEGLIGSFYSEERYTRTLYAKFSEDFQYLTLKEVISVSESSKHQWAKNETIITAYYIRDSEAQFCTSQKEFESKYLKIWDCPRCKGIGQVNPNPKWGGPDESVGICPCCGGHAKYISSPFK